MGLILSGQRTSISINLNEGPLKIKKCGAVFFSVHNPIFPRAFPQFLSMLSMLSGGGNFVPTERAMPRRPADARARLCLSPTYPDDPPNQLRRSW